MSTNRRLAATICASASLDADHEVVSGWLDLEPHEVAGLFGPIRRGLRKVSWDSEDPDPGKREYRYRKCEGGCFAPDFAQLSEISAPWPSPGTPSGTRSPAA